MWQTQYNYFMTLEEIRAKIRCDSPADGGIALLSEYIVENPEDDEARTVRGMRYWSLGKHAKAIEDYLAAIRINPDSRAKMALKATNDILDYYNKDLYNP